MNCRVVAVAGVIFFGVIFCFGVVAIAEKIVARAEASHPLACRELSVTGAECSAAVQQ